MRAAPLLVPLLTAFILPCQAQSRPLGETADLEIVLVQEGEPGTAVYGAAGDPILSTEDFAALELELSAGRLDANARYNLLLTLTPIGAQRLAQASRAHPGRLLVLRSRGRTFNALRLNGPFSGRRLVWRALLPESILEAWAEHILGEAAGAAAAELPAD